MNSRPVLDCQIAILGYGPVGATLANLLGAAGLDVLVIERDTEVFAQPRAIHFDGETMRVFETLGLRSAVEAISRPGMKGMHFMNAADEVLLVRAGTGLDGPHGCANNHYFHQPHLESVLRAGLERYPNVRVLHGMEAIAIETSEIGATIDLQSAKDDETRRLNTQWLVGCDGARSITRRVIGTPVDDLGLHQPWLVFDVILERDPGLPDYTIQRCDPARPMTICCVTERRRRWEVMLMPGDDPRSIVRPENVWPLIERWVTPADAHLERSAVYTFHSVLAREWRSGPLLIAGDAAHQTPPFLGQGLCAGIRDAANLAWKLERVARGTAPATLLDTYASERKPHVQAFIDLAVQLGDIIQTTDVQQAAERDRRFLAGDAKVFEFPSPALGAGLHTGPSGGVLFPQPRLADGVRLDQRVGYGFAVIADPTFLADTPAPVVENWQRRWADAGATWITDPGPAILQWLTEHDTRAAIIRPDRYVLGTATTSDTLNTLGGMMLAGIET